MYETDIDLIPADYRQHVRLKFILRIYLIVSSIMVLFVVAGRIWAGNLIEQEKAIIKKLEIEEGFVLEKSKQLEKIKSQESYLKTHLERLNTLRGGPSAEEMFVAVGSAITPSTWITYWKFVRAGEIKQRESERRKTGYFLVKIKEKKKTWHEQTYMEIRGQALTHSILANFVKRLLAQLLIDNVHILKTGTSTSKGSKVINYNLILTIKAV